jgi:hypothetical protein
MFAGSSRVAVLVALAACGGGEAAPVRKPAVEFELQAPIGFRQVPVPAELAAASPSGAQVLGAWEGETLSNGFTPTLRVAREPTATTDVRAACEAWRERMARHLAATYVEVKVVGGTTTIEGPAAPGCMLVAKVGLPVASRDDRPVPLFAYGAAYPRGQVVYSIAAMTGAAIDAQTGEIMPMKELGILRAMTSFHTTAKAVPPSR